MNNSSINILHVTDTHLLADKEASLLGVNTEQSFQAVIKTIQNAKIKFDLIIHSGDMSQDCSEASYERLAEELSEFNVPIYCVPGNHDDLKTMMKVFPHENMSRHQHIVLKNWHLILLNSKQPNVVEGHLDQTQLNYLQHCLQTYPEHHALVIFHHHPILVGSTWLDKLNLKNADEFWEIVSHYPKVNTVLFGHVHQEVFKMKDNIKCIATPSTCIQFKRNQNEFGLEKLPPGCRILQLYGDGRLETAVHRVPEYIGHFEENAKNY